MMLPGWRPPDVAKDRSHLRTKLPDARIVVTILAEVRAMSDVIFQSSDLANKRVEVLDAARAGLARVRDKDGTSLVMLPEADLDLLKELNHWSVAHMRLEALLQRTPTPTVTELGDLAWLRVFDKEELTEFLDELHSALVAADADRSVNALTECVNSWRTTARQLEDPLRRSILKSSISKDDLVEVGRPEHDEYLSDADSSDD